MNDGDALQLIISHVSRGAADNPIKTWHDVKFSNHLKDTVKISSLADNTVSWTTGNDSWRHCKRRNTYH
jgi:hypothetical protein